MEDRRSYSVDLRERVIQVRQRGGWTLEETADFFSIGVATVNRWFRRLRETGGVSPRMAGRGPAPKLQAKDFELIGELVKQKPDRTGAELVKLFQQQQGISVSRTTINRALRKLGLSFKKKPYRRPNESVKMSKSSGGVLLPR